MTCIFSFGMCLLLAILFNLTLAVPLPRSFTNDVHVVRGAGGGVANWLPKFRKDASVESSAPSGPLQPPKVLNVISDTLSVVQGERFAQPLPVEGVASEGKASTEEKVQTFVSEKKFQEEYVEGLKDRNQEKPLRVNDSVVTYETVQSLGSKLSEEEKKLMKTAVAYLRPLKTSNIDNMPAAEQEEIKETGRSLLNKIKALRDVTGPSASAENVVEELVQLLKEIEEKSDPSDDDEEEDGDEFETFDDVDADGDDEQTGPDDADEDDEQTGSDDEPLFQDVRQLDDEDVEFYGEDDFQDDSVVMWEDFEYGNEVDGSGESEIPTVGGETAAELKEKTGQAPSQEKLDEIPSYIGGSFDIGSNYDKQDTHYSDLAAEAREVVMMA